MGSLWRRYRRSLQCHCQFLQSYRRFLRSYHRSLRSPLEFFFQEQSYSSLPSGRSLAWDHVRGDIDDPCGAIADFCGVIADFCGVVADFCGVIAIPEAIGGRAGADAATAIVVRLAKHHKTLLNIVKHHETHVKHCETL